MNKELKTVSIAEIVPYDNNPRINAPAIEAVKESIRQCGYIAPIVVDDNMVILAGHTRYQCLMEMGKKKVEVLICTGLSDEQKKKYRLLDNKTNELAMWDLEKLDVELDDIDFDGFDFGFMTKALDFTEQAPSYEYDTDDSYEDDREHGYSITYEVAFNSEEEQEKWYRILKSLKAAYPDVGTIAERLLIALDRWAE